MVCNGIHCIIFDYERLRRERGCRPDVVTSRRCIALVEISVKKRSLLGGKKTARVSPDIMCLQQRRGDVLRTWTVRPRSFEGSGHTSRRPSGPGDTDKRRDRSTYTTRVGFRLGYGGRPRNFTFFRARPAVRSH